jgi:putative ABC transport system permease protein
MFKNMLKRSWLSTVRKAGRTIILVIILFVMANMLLATVAIRNSVNKSTEYAKEKLGGIVYLQPDMEKINEKMQANMQATDEGGEATDFNFTMPTISEKLAKNIAESNYIKDYTYSLNATANASGFTAVETAQNERERQFRDALDDAKNQVDEQVKEYNDARENYNATRESDNVIAGPGGQRRNFNFNFDVNLADPNLSRGDITLQGINSFNFVSEVESGSMKIVDGAAFDESTADAALVSRELAEKNSWSVGDEITLKTVTDETEKKLKIVGFYSVSTEDFNANTIYMNITTLKQFLSDPNATDLTVENVRYYLTSASDKDAFLAETAKNQPNLTSDGLKLDVDDSSYQTMVGPIENVGSFAVTVMWIVIIAAVVIITLIVVINVKDRRYEMGVLLSLGATRKNILGQIFVELVIVGTVGFLASLGTSQIVASKMGEGLLKQQIASATTTTSTTEQTTTFTVGGPNGGGRSMSRGLNAPTANVEQIKEIDVQAGLNEYLILFGAGYLILIIAMILPSVNILRYQPKTILTGKE